MSYEIPYEITVIVDLNDPFLSNYSDNFSRDVQIYLAGSYRQCNTLLFIFQAIRVNTGLEKF